MVPTARHPGASDPTTEAAVPHQRSTTVRPPELRVLGGFELRLDDRPVPLVANARRVLAFLAVGGQIQRRETLAGQLWGDSSQERAQACLRTALWRVRQADLALVRVGRDQVSLGPCVEVDLWTSTDRARCLLGGEPPAAGPAEWGGLLEADLLPDWDEDWVALERERHRQLRIHALEALSASLVAIGRFGAAIDAAYAAIAAEPLREPARAALIQAHLAEGNRVEAARQLGMYRQLLRDELDLGPSDDLEALVEVGR
jgi:DNA-binding SARP family transcriptional activator